MPHLVALRVEVAPVICVGGNDYGNSLDNLQTVSAKPRDFARIVREKPQLADSEIDEYLRSLSVVAQIRREAKRDIGLDGV